MATYWWYPCTCSINLYLYGNETYWALPGEARECKSKRIIPNWRFKTAAGKERIIPLADCIMPFIKEIYSKAHFSRSETLLPTKWIPTRLSRPIKRLCEVLGLSKHKPHDTRHTFITLARNVDMDIYILKSIVGNTHTGDVTSNMYTHKMRKQFLDVVNTLPVTFTEEMMSMAK